MSGSRIAVGSDRSWNDIYYDRLANGGNGKYKSRREIREAIANGVACEICDGPAEVPDHCHKTRKWRGPLCGMCNSGLGFFEDSPGLLRSAAEYLERYSLPSPVNDEDKSYYIGDPFG